LGEELVQSMVLEGFGDPVVGHGLRGCNLGAWLAAGRLEQQTPEAMGHRASPGDLGMAFTTGASTVTAGEAALGPQEHDRIAAGAIADATQRSGMRGDIERSAMVTGGSERGTHLDLKHAVDHLTVADIEAVEVQRNTDTIAHGGLPSSGFVTEEAREASAFSADYHRLFRRETSCHNLR